MVNGDADCRGRWGFDLVLKFLKMIFFFLKITLKTELFC